MVYSLSRVAAESRLETLWTLLGLGIRPIPYKLRARIEIAAGAALRGTA